jgi:galactokinase
VWIAFRPRMDRRVRLQSLDFDERLDLDLNRLRKDPPAWAEYVRGVAWAIHTSGRLLRGWEGVMSGDVPIGAGLSSSAALELASARVFSAVSAFSWEPEEMARQAQRAENEWVGVRCGLMDQLISAAGQEGQALLMDCRSSTHEPVPLPPGISIVVMDTGTRRSLSDSAYNQRRAECEAAAAALGVDSLRDVSPSAFRSAEAGLPEPLGRRARHVVAEIDRTLHAAEAMRRGDAIELGRLIDASHISLRDDFEVSSPELNAMVNAAHQQPGCLGARMTGAGFGGCAVAIVRSEDTQGFLEGVPPRYEQLTGRPGKVIRCVASGGARLLA